MDPVTVNWAAVLVASLVGFGVGFFWYGPLFGEAWMKASGISEEDINKANLLRIFLFTFIIQFIMAVCLAYFFGNQTTAVTGALYGLLTGLPWVGGGVAVNALFEQKNLKYILINTSYWAVTFTLMGIIIGAWH